MRFKINDCIIDCVVTDLMINNVNQGKVICDWEVLSVLMDDELRNQLHNEFASTSNEEFLAAYLERDPDFMRVIQQIAYSIDEIL